MTDRTAWRRRGWWRPYVAVALSAADDGPCIDLPLAQSQTRIGIYYQGTGRNASRVVWMMAHGDPGDLQVLHTCGRGNAGCIRLGHLYLGTPAQNVQDAIADGTLGLIGEQNPYAKLTDGAIRDIRQSYAAGGVTQASLALEYGVDRKTVSKVIHRKTWRHLP